MCSRSVTNLRKQTRTQSGDVVKYQLVILGFVTVAQDSCWYLATNWIIAFAYSQITYWLVHAITAGAGTTFLHFSPHASSVFFFPSSFVDSNEKRNLNERGIGINVALSSVNDKLSILTACSRSIESLFRIVISQLIMSN